MVFVFVGPASIIIWNEILGSEQNRWGGRRSKKQKRKTRKNQGGSAISIFFLPLWHFQFPLIVSLWKHNFIYSMINVINSSVFLYFPPSIFSVHLTFEKWVRSANQFQCNIKPIYPVVVLAMVTSVVLGFAYGYCKVSIFSHVFWLSVTVFCEQTTKYDWGKKVQVQ